MTTKISISLPDDVAAWVAEQPNASAAIVRAVRAHIHFARTEEVLRAAGIEVTEAGKRRWRERLAQPIPADAVEEGRRLLGHAP